MILLASALAIAAPTANGMADDIVVTAAKLRKMRISANTDRSGRVTKCDVTVSSGDAELDRHACEATRQCTKAGLDSSKAVGDCVDRQLVMFVNAGHEPENENDAPNQ